ncbi:MAG: 2-succinyl-5-enolpyruvyl-6-hydroxy-3-cyclohexene-1-carboxylic-acid synthase, partial [Pseudomonadota bacterium]
MTENLLGEWARLLLGSLAKAGVEDVVVSPGSRSTPFVWAALSTPGLRCHSIVDERSAGFFALGQARVSGRPSVVLSTSGSAAANYFPAVVEAAYGFTPLVVLTADRPLELQEAGGLQCMDQVKLYGGMVRRFFDLGHPEGTPAALDGLERRVAQAVSEAIAPTPGPVHLNVRARKPLEPAPPTTVEGEALARAVDERLAREPVRIFERPGAPSAEAVAEVARSCARTGRGLVVCGPIAAARASDVVAVFDLARALGFPLYVEATSQARFALPRERDGLTVIGNGDTLFASPLLERAPPELVLLLGHPPTSSACAR